MSKTTLTLIERLRSAARIDRTAAEEIDPEHYTPDDPVDIVAGLVFYAEMMEEAAAALEALAASTASDKQEAVTDAQIDEVFLQWNSNCHGGPLEAHRRFARLILALAAPLAQSAEQDRIDAERYRWLRDEGETQWHIVSQNAGEYLDAAIDAAIAKEKQG